MENRNIVNYTILPTTAVKISLIWENVWTISTNEPQLRVYSLQKYLWFFISFFIYAAFVCSMELFPRWRNDQENYKFYENYFIPRWFMYCRQFQLHNSQRWTDMADNLPEMKEDWQRLNNTRHLWCNSFWRTFYEQTISGHIILSLIKYLFQCWILFCYLE